jgi:hypothetical protein
MHLRASESWAQANVGIPEEQALRELRYQNKEFVGFLVDTPILSLLDLSALKEKLHDVLSEHCPELPKNTIQPQLFPQVYIA